MNCSASRPLQQELFVALELLRFGYLHGSPFVAVGSSPLEKKESVSSERIIRLICRVFSLLPLRFEDNATWMGSLDRDLLAFNSVARVLSRTLRSILEMIALDLYIDEHITVNSADMHRIAGWLPFVQETNTGFGIVMKHLLTHAGDDIELAKASALDSFPACADITGDLKFGVEFWRDV